MRKNVGPSAWPGERAHDVISILMLEHEWSLSFKAWIWSLRSQTEPFFTTRVKNLTLPIILVFLSNRSDANHFLCIPLRITIPVWNEETRGSDLKIKSITTSNLGTNKNETCSKEGSTSDAGSIQRHSLPRGDICDISTLFQPFRFC